MLIFEPRLFIILVSSSHSVVAWLWPACKLIRVSIAAAIEVLMVLCVSFDVDSDALLCCLP